MPANHAEKYLIEVARTHGYHYMRASGRELIFIKDDNKETPRTSERWLVYEENGAFVREYINFLDKGKSSREEFPSWFHALRRP